MLVLALVTWVAYTVLLLWVLRIGLLSKRIGLVAFVTLLAVVSNLRQPLLFLGLSYPHPQHQFQSSEWDLVLMANMVLIAWVFTLFVSYLVNGRFGLLFVNIFPHRLRLSVGGSGRWVFLVILVPFFASVGGTLFLIQKFGGFSNFVFAVKISKDLAGAYVFRALAALSCAMIFYAFLSVLGRRDALGWRRYFLLSVYSTMMFMCLATIFAWGNRYSIALVVLAILLGWHYHVRKISIIKLVSVVIFAGIAFQALKYIRFQLIADALGRQDINTGHDFWLNISLSLHLVEFDALMLALKDAGSRFDFRGAQDFINGLLAWVPRFIYPDKETFHIGGWFRRLYEPWTINGWPITTPGSWYVNFSWPGVFIGAWISGLFLRGFDAAFKHVDICPWQAAVGPFLAFFLFEAGVSMGFVQNWFLYALPLAMVLMFLSTVSGSKRKILSEHVPTYR